ncbi:PKD domain-containing protein [Musicola keenii]|uniref:PKD domain-containing protein n=1 Tax=Musicola keenii TaxID=2884250 RepID=UPI00177F5126|nr:PKD domain-containing protein [Musicola keenii]
MIVLRRFFAILCFLLSLSAFPSAASSLKADLSYVANQLTLNFDGGASGGGEDIVSYSWIFGDGDTANGTRVAHTYAASGNYTVTLTVTDSTGNNATQTATVYAGEVRTGFEDGMMSPMTVCTTQGANFVAPAQVYDEGLNTVGAGGETAIKVKWFQSAYNGTRMTKGAEMCSPINIYKEAWIGFMFYLPANGYPTDKEAGMFQIFEAGGCSSWAGMLTIVNNSLRIAHRGACGSATQKIIVADLTRDAWIPVVIHLVASHQSEGQLQIWVGDAAQNAPTYSVTGINLGFGDWNDDELASGSQLYFKFGQYDYDTSNYTDGETRTSYYDNVHILGTAADNGWSAVHPTASSFAYSGTAYAASTQPVVTRTAEYAFDGSADTKWQGSGQSGWLQYRYADHAATAITHYTLTSASSAAARDPLDWALLGSNDGKTWTTLDTRSGQTFSSRSMARSFSITSPGSYAYYRLRVDANHGDTAATHLGELTLTP